MSCTAAEIAEKKRIAMERLAQRRSQATASSNEQINGSPTVVAPRSSSTFYGQSTPSKIATGPQSYETKMKGKQPYRNKNRILSQPYPSSGAKTTDSTSSKPETKSGIAPVFQKSVTLSCEVVSLTRFQVKVVGFHGKLIEVFKSMPTRSYGESSE